jgi:hypothetical protein
MRTTTVRRAPRGAAAMPQGHRAGRVLVPARVAVVAALLVLAHLDDAEHAAHADGAEGPLPVIIGAVLSGSGISISVMSFMPRSPITM